MFTARSQSTSHHAFSCLFSLLLSTLLLGVAGAQTEVTGAFQGYVVDGQGKPIANATISYINQDTQAPVYSRSDAQGQFFKRSLLPARYVIEVSAPGYKTVRMQMILPTQRSSVVIPKPIVLEPEVAPLPAAPQPALPPVPIQQPIQQPAQQPAIQANVGPIIDSINVSAELNLPDARRGGTFTGEEVAALPLGGSTFTRSFDELALLLPGVALPPQTQSGVAGPGVGPGVGSAGQFAVNGLRSRGNNFTVDGSDNNDEDIGVRRQGFFTLVPQSIESIKEYQITTAVAPAQYGRNLGAQVNANSKSGGFQTHGSFYGFFNSSQLSSRDFFDTTSNGRPIRLQAIVPATGAAKDVYLNGRPFDVVNPAAGQDSQTFGQGGFVVGGPLLPKPAVNSNKSAFYLLSFEGQLLNANKERSFAVPTVEERGLNESGATGICISGQLGVCRDQNDRRGYPTNLQGDAIFSLYPFPNNPGGIYGRNTFTQILPASAQGNIASIKLDHNFKFKEREQSVTARYNRTDDWRNIPAAGNALFATLRPVVRTNNFSFFHNSELTGPAATKPISNQFRASYGRTNLLFEEERDVDHLIPSRLLPNEPFLLNARYRENFTLPTFPGNPNPPGNFVDYRDSGQDSELFGTIGPLGQLIIAGYSTLGVDVFNFPQRRVNNTYQLADTATMLVNTHNLAFGGDFRRTDLVSNLPRNSRPLMTVGSTTAVDPDSQGRQRVDAAGNVIFSRFVTPANRAAVGAPNNLSQTLALNTSHIGLRYYQLNFFAQDEWRLRPNLSLSYGLRYEYNTPPREVSGLIENTFKDSRLGLLPGLQGFLKNREQIFDPDRNNFAPRVGLAYSRNIFGANATVFRLGYGLFYDQALGAVVSQSRNVFPNFLTLNTGGGLGTISGAAGRGLGQYGVFNTARSLGPNAGNGLCYQVLASGGCAPGRFFPYVVFGTLNQLNPNIALNDLVGVINRDFPDGFGFTLPDKEFPMPMAHQYAFTIEQQMGASWALSLAYVGTRGVNLLRLTTPNLGPNLVLPAVYFNLSSGGLPFTFGYRLTPGQSLKPNPADPNNREVLLLNGSRPVNGIGTVYLYQTNADSRYDSFQVQLRGQLRANFQGQLSYTFAKALDDVSDVFDLAGASALPQNNAALRNERGPANFDVRSRFAASFNYQLPGGANRDGVTRLLLGGFELAGTWQYQSGQPFTINSLFDINSDGNYTDRLNTMDGVTLTRSNNRNPVQLGFDRANVNSTLRSLALCDTTTAGGVVRALCGKDGAVGRNTFRAGDFFLVNMALVKNFIINERHRVTFRTEAFNLADRANFGVPVRFLEAPSFGQAVDTVTPGRRIQFALKYSF